VSEVGYTAGTNGAVSPVVSVPKVLWGLVLWGVVPPGAETDSVDPPGANPTLADRIQAGISGRLGNGVRYGSAFPLGKPKGSSTGPVSRAGIPDITVIAASDSRRRDTTARCRRPIRGRVRVRGPVRPGRMDSKSSGLTPGPPLPGGHRPTVVPEAIAIERRRDRGHFTCLRTTTRSNRADHRRRRRKQRGLGRMRYVRSPPVGPPGPPPPRAVSSGNADGVGNTIGE